jgi:nicotinamide mononucleotide (NMN) deamidase PncC
MIKLRQTVRSLSEGSSQKEDSQAKGPTEFKYFGGRILSSVEVVPIYWGHYWLTDPGAKLAAQIDQFFDYILQSYFMDALREYGTAKASIGYGRRVQSVFVDSDPWRVSLGRRTVGDRATSDMIIAGAKDGSIPAWTENTIYFVYYPPQVYVFVELPGVVTSTKISCDDFCAFHVFPSLSQLKQSLFAAIPFPNCDACHWGSDFESLTAMTSHELAESITDVDGRAWLERTSAAEIGDVCAPDSEGAVPGAFLARLGGYLVQSFWSQDNAACVVSPWRNADLTQGLLAPTGTDAALVAYIWNDYKQVAYRSENGHVHELFVSAGNPWVHADLTMLIGAPLASDHALAAFTWENYKQIVYVGPGGHIFELNASTDAGWGCADLTEIAGAPAALHKILVAYTWDKYKQVVYLTADGHIHELFASADQGWAHADLTAITGCPAALTDSLIAYLWEEYKQIAYITADGHIHELSASVNQGWAHTDLTAFAGAPVAARGTLAACAWNNYKQIAYVTPNGHIHELYAATDQPWLDGDLSGVTAAPAPDQGTLGYYLWKGSKRLTYIVSNGHMHELFVSATVPWTHEDLTEITRSPTASSTTRPVGYEWDGYRQIVYLRSNGHVQELYAR